MTNINSLNQSDDYQRAGFGSDSDSSEIDLRFVAAQLRRNRGLLLGSLLLGLLLGMVYYLSAPREFTAHTTLMINIEGELASQQGGDLLGALAAGKPDAIAPAFAIARSTALLEQVVDERRLVLDPEFNAELRELTLKERIIVALRPVGAAISALVNPGGAGGDDFAADADWSNPEVLEKRHAIIALGSRVTVTDLQDDLRLRISVTTGDRVKSAEIAETMATKLNGFMRNTKVSALGNARKWIEGEATRVETTLREIELQINAEMSAGTVSPDSEALGQNAERLVEGELILESNRRRSEALTRLGEVVSRIEGGQNPAQAFVSMPDDLRSELSTDYAPIFQWEKRDAAPSRTDLLAATRLIERDLESQTAATSRREQEILPVRAYTRRLSTAQNRYLQLQTSYQGNTNLLRTLRERLAELQIELAGEVERMTVLESPEPPLQHSSPRFMLTLVLSSLLGLLAGVVLMLTRFFKRDAFMSLEDVEKTFDAPAVAIVSDIRRGLQGGFAWDKLPTEIQEAYRRAYSAVFVMPDEQGSRSLMVTSSIPGEGKTTTSLYTAAAAAEEGRRTLVIDLDFRKQSVSRYLKLKSDLGVYSVFRGDATLQEAVVRYGGEGGFDVLTTDGRQKSSEANSRETLSAKDVRELIAVAKDEYEVVIVDVPPILAVQDANMIGRMVDAIFCVVSTQALQKKAAQRASKEWKRAGLTLFGLIVRGEKNELHEYYDYSYYHYDYAASKEDGRARRPSQRRRKRTSDVGRHQASGGARD